MSLIANWTEVLNTANLSADRPMDAVSRWLIIIRAAVFSMTATSGLIGGLLASDAVTDPDWLNFGLAVLGLIVAHAANNMTNDYFDLQGGVDTDEYARALYAPHPILGGLISKRGLLAAILTAHLIDAAILTVLIARSGWAVLIFALLGLFISVFYVAPPIRLKHHGLGEPGVAIVWGPLMIGGTYLVTAGQMPTLGAWLACLPFALIVTTVLIGKHVDKREADMAKGIRTLPVMIGDRASKILNLSLMIGYYVLVVVLVLAGTLGAWALLVFLAFPRLVRAVSIYRQPKPASPPRNYPVWPLWFVSAAFYHSKLAGGMFVLGLILNRIFPVSL